MMNIRVLGVLTLVNSEYDVPGDTDPGGLNITALGVLTQMDSEYHSPGATDLGITSTAGSRTGSTSKRHLYKCPNVGRLKNAPLSRQNFPNNNIDLS